MSDRPITKVSRETRGLPVAVTTLVDVLSSSEVELLRKFSASQLADYSNLDKLVNHELGNRPDSWDETGLVSRLQELFRSYIKSNFFLLGNIEPRQISILCAPETTGYREKYGLFENNGEVIYTAIVPLSYSKTDYLGGDIVYTKPGEGGYGAPGQMLIHRNETINSWMLEDVDSGTRLDLILVQQEVRNLASYTEFSIDQTVYDTNPY